MSCRKITVVFYQRTTNEDKLGKKTETVVVDFKYCLYLLSVFNIYSLFGLFSSVVKATRYHRKYVIGTIGNWNLHEQ